jgi:hypothetical protein
MKTTTITVLLDGEPLPDAEVCIGEYLERFVTADENGQISRQFEDDFAIVAPVTVRKNGIAAQMGRTMLIEAGGNYTINIRTPDYP